MGSRNQSYATPAKSNPTPSPISFTQKVPTLQAKTQDASTQQQLEWSPEQANQSTKSLYRQPPQSLVSRLPIQARLTVGAVGDKYEQEADQVAAQVVKTINQPQGQGAVQQKSANNGNELQMKISEKTVQREEEEEDEVQMKPQGAIQRDEEEEELQMKPNVQRTGAEGGPVAADLESEINSARGGGQVLASSLQQNMGEAIGADFSGVKVHTDTRADQLNQSIQAKAFTTGQDVFFRQGEYNPSSQGGQELIAHELTHVVQQNGGSSNMVNRDDDLTSASDALTKKVAKLHMHVDLDAPDKHILKQLTSGEVGHAWVSLEWNDPNTIPGDLPKAHREQIKKGKDPFGFWPKKFQWNDYTGLTADEIWDKIQEDNSAKYATIENYLRSPEFKEKFKKEAGRDLTDDDINDYVVEAIEEDAEIAELWGGFHTGAPDSVGYSQNPFNSYVPGQVLHPDYMHDAKATQTYDVTKGEVDKVLQYAEAKKNADYSVFYYNCTTFAKEAVKVAGKPAPKAGHLGVCYPDKLYKSIKSNFEKGKGTTSLDVNGKMVEKVGIALESSKKKK